MFVAADAKCRTNILEYVRRQVCKMVYEAQKREHDFDADVPTDRKVIETGLDSNIAWYVNHHFSSNAALVEFHIRNKTILVIRAAQAIAKTTK